MKNNLYFIFNSIFIAICIAFQWNSPLFAQPYVKQCRNGHTININDLLKQRIPAFDTRNIPDECKAQVEAKVKDFEREDMNNWERLSNQACSHLEGWVEKVPGTCEAGGPPPICPVDHWVQEPEEAMAVWNRLQKEVYDKRRKEISDLACGCWADLADKKFSADAEQRTTEHNPSASNPFTTGMEKDDIKVPCYGGQCPPGYSCKNGVCINETGVQKIFDNPVGKTVVDKVIDHEKEFTVSEALKYMSPILLKLYKGYNASSVGIALDILDYTKVDLSVWSQAYSNEMKRINEELSHYEELIDKNKRNIPYKSCKQCVDSMQMAIYISNSKYRLGEEFKNLNSDYSGILMEKESCHNCCDKVFTVYHKWFCYYFGKIVN